MLEFYLVLFDSKMNFLKKSAIVQKVNFLFHERTIIDSVQSKKTTGGFLSPSQQMDYSRHITHPSRLNLMCSAQIRNIQTLSESDMGYLTPAEIKKTIKIFHSQSDEGFTCVTVDCPCRKDSTTLPKASCGKLYINSKTGDVFCKKCLLTGSFSKYTEFLKQQSSNHGDNNGFKNISEFLKVFTSSQVDVKKMNECWATAQDIDSIPPKKLEELLEKLHLKVLTVKTLKKLNAKINLKLQQLVLPVKLSVDGTPQALKIISPKNLVNNAQSEKDDGVFSPLVEESNIPENHPWLLGYDLVKEKDEVVLTSSASDTLIAIQNSSKPVVCLPTGISQLPLMTLAYLEPFKKITLWLDQGIQGWESSTIFAKKLVESRCYFVRPTIETPSATRCQLKGINLDTVISAAKPISHKAVTTFSSLRDEVYAEVTQTQKTAGVRWCRFPILTEMLKGHRRGELTVFTGPTGAGKTTFISEYALDLCMQKVNTLWGSFEIRNVRLAKMMLQQFCGGPLDQDPRKFDLVADEFEKLAMFFLTFHGQQTVKAVVDAMAHAVYVHDIGHVIIDNLQFMMGTSDSSSLDRFYQQDQIVGIFRRFATLHNVHITLVIHPRKEEGDELSTSSIFGGAKASQEADNILILQDKRLADPSKRRKYIQVTKNRYSGDLGVMPLEFHKEALSFSTQRKKLSKSSSTSAHKPLAPTLKY